VTRRALFVGGPWHGTIRDLPADTGIVIYHAELPELRLPLPEQPPEDVSYRQRSYTRQRYATREVDGHATVEIWLYDDVPDTDHLQVADAALRCLIRDGSLPHRFHPERDTWRQVRDPRLVERERCTPAPPRPRPWQEALAEALADAERAKHSDKSALDEP
jgi:hypothetical protein